MTRNRRSLGIHHLSFALPGRSILLHFSRDRFFSPPWSCCTRLLLPRPLSFSLGKVPLLSLFFILSSLILSHPPFSGLSSSRFFLSAPPTFFHLPRRLLAATPAVATREKIIPRALHYARCLHFSQSQFVRRPFCN